MAEIEPEIQRGLEYILEAKESLESMELTFEAETVVFGDKVTHNLKPYGSLIKVTQSNKSEYVSRYANWIVNDSVEKQFLAFKKGFYRVVTGDMIKLFSAEELEKIICGSDTFDFK